jgi:hypothetical protein
MTEPNGSSVDRRRGVGFPQMGLQEAVDAVVRAGQNGRDHSNDAFATYLGHSTPNSGAFRSKLASLRDWGLIERGDKDRVVLSALAQEFVLAVPDHYQARQLLLTAFESCRVFGVVYNDSAKNTPMDASRIRSNALMRVGVAAEQADRFVDSFIKSAVFAGLGEFDGSRLTLRPRVDVLSGDEDPLDESSAPPPPGAAFVPSPAAVTGPITTVATTSAPIALRQSWDIEGGEIEFVIRTPKPLLPDIYMLVADMATTAKKMAELLKPSGTCELSDANDGGNPG